MSTPQGTARQHLRQVARTWTTEDLADLPVYDEEPYSLDDSAHYHYRYKSESTLYMSEYVWVDTTTRTATLTVRWYTDSTGNVYAAPWETDCAADYGDVDMAHTSRISAAHRARVAEGVRAALEADWEHDWSGFTII